MFKKIADGVAIWTGSPLAVALSFVFVVVWAVSGPVFGFSDTWQLVINTATTVITFWMVFLIQAAQNRSDKAVHAKLDELIHASSARNRVIDVDEGDEEDLDAIREGLRQEKNYG